MTLSPIISHFFGTPVRFFPMNIEAEMGSRNMTPPSCHSHQKTTIKTYGVPLPDYCRAINYKEHAIRQIIRTNNEVFQYFYKTEKIPDALGRFQPTIIIAMEMCDMLTAKLHTSRIKNPIIKTKIIDTQLWMMLTFGMIRRGELRPIHFPKDSDIPPQILNYLSCKKHKGRGELMQEACAELGFSKNTFYRMVDKAKKICGILPKPTKKTGQPKRTRSDKGTTWYPTEKARVLEFKRQHPKAGYKQISTALDLVHLRDRIKYWLKETI